MLNLGANQPMFLTEERRVALISVDGDQAVEIGQEGAGSQSTYVHKVGESLAQQGWQVDLFTRRRSADQPAVTQHKSNFRTIRLVAGPQDFVPRDELFHYLPEFVQQLQKFQRQEGFQYPLIHTNYWLSSWVGMELKKHQPLMQVHTCHSLGVDKYRAVADLPAIAATRLAVEKACLETADRIVATSPREREYIQTWVDSSGPIEMIPCGTDADWFGSVQRQSARQKLDIAVDTKLVLYVGRFDPSKGIETLVRAVAQSSLRGKADLKLVIAGGGQSGESEGIERDRIKRLVAELGLSDLTIFPGRLGKTDLPIYYAAADVCVVPSYYEPFGLAAIESMASSTPVVASNIGGLQFTVVPEVTGLLVPPKDEVALAQAFDRILADPNWRDQLGHTGRQRVEIAFGWNNVAARLGHLYTRLLAQQPTDVRPEQPQIAA